jgi:hypothetical protein
MGSRVTAENCCGILQFAAADVKAAKRTER